MDLIVLVKELSLIIAVVTPLFALREMGIESIMVNSNPETVSTDHDISSRLYIEPLVMENIRAIIENERNTGDLGWRNTTVWRPNSTKLAKALEAMEHLY